MMPAPRAPEETIFLSLREAILSRRLAPGTRLREVQLGKIFGATRGAVRKALGRLTFEGLVEHEPNRGASVARPTAEEAAELFTARKCIEVAVAQMAAKRLTPGALRDLEATLEQERAAQARGDAAQIIALSGKFHVLIAEIAGNAPLKRYLEDLVARESLIIQFFGTRLQSECSGEEHALIVEALRSADPELIARRIEHHIDGIAARLDLEPRATETRTLEEILRGD